MAAGVIVVGSANVDLVGVAPRLPGPGETVLGERFVTNMGGKGANQAVACRRLGVPTAFVGRVGRDSFGAEVRASLQGAGVDTAGLREDDQAATGVALIMVSAAGENSILVAPGANFTLMPEEVTRSLEGQSTGLVLAQLEVPLPAVLAAARWARRSGARFVLNPAPAQAVPDELLRLVDVITPNQHELARLAGVPTGDPESTSAAARHLLSRGVGSVVVTLGGAGSEVVTPAEERTVPPARVQVVDTTGAGDAFNGGLVAALLRGSSLGSAALFANACGGLATTALGAQSALPTLAQVEALLDEQFPGWAARG